MMMEDGGWSPHTEEEEEEEERATIYTIALLCSRRVSTFMYSSETQYIALCYTFGDWWCTRSHTRMYSLAFILVTLLTSQDPSGVLNC